MLRGVVYLLRMDGPSSSPPSQGLPLQSEALG